MKTGICSYCNEHCEIVIDDGREYIDSPATGKYGKYRVRAETEVSNCCYAPLIDEAAPEVDEVETHSGKMPYGGGNERR